MNRTSIIQSLIDKINATSYLEIGISSGENFNKINCNYKVSVDPESSTFPTFCLTSDEFFEHNQEKFDIIFIDGLHHSEQVYKDIINSLNILNDGGYIICHDMNPQKEEHQIIPFAGGLWNGDCWKAFVKLRQERCDLSLYTIDADYGCSIIQKGNQELLSINEEINYHNFDKNRKEWLNLISVEDFCKKLGFNIHSLLKNYINNSEDAENNFNLALYYHQIGQTASALSFYLRCAERTDDVLLKYECLIRGSMCFDSQGTRNFTVKGLLLHALTLCPKRPEAYYLMSKFYEKENKDGSWNECYTISSIGLQVADLSSSPLRTNVNYPGDYALLFQKAVSSWWCGLCEESRDLLLDLLENYQMEESFRQKAIDNLKKMNVEVESFTSYNKSVNIRKNISIPVIGVPVVSNPYWVTRLLMSIDYPVDNFVIINNNGRGEIDDELNSLTKITHKFVKNIKVCHLPANIGCGGAWNLIIKSYMMAPYWIIVNDDVAFASGFLKEMAETAESDQDIGMIHGHEGDFGIGSWDLFLIRDHIIQEYGLFDENLYPAYCEDSDYIMRFQHRPIKKVLSLKSNYYHGHGDKTEYYKEGSQTQKSEPNLKEKLDFSNNENIKYLNDKWGQDWRVCNPQEAPFKGKEHLISETTYDLNFVRKKHLGF